MLEENGIDFTIPVDDVIDGDDKKSKSTTTNGSKIKWDIPVGNVEESLNNQKAIKGEQKTSQYKPATLDEGITDDITEKEVQETVDVVTEVNLKEQIKKEEKTKQEYNNVITSIVNLGDVSKLSVDLSDDEDVNKEIDKYAKENSLSFEEAGRKLGYDVSLSQLKPEVTEETEDEATISLKRKYNISKGQDQLAYLGNKDSVLKYIEEQGVENVNKLLGIELEENPAKGHSFGGGILSDAMVVRQEVNWKEDTYNAFIDGFYNKYKPIVDQQINDLGKNYMYKDFSENATALLKSGFDMNFIRATTKQLADEEAVTTAGEFFIMQGDKPRPVYKGTVINSVTGRPYVDESSNRTSGVNIDKADAVALYINEEDPVKKQEYKEELISMYSKDGDTAITEEDLSTDEKTKEWYRKYIQRGLKYDIKEDYSFLYDPATGKLLYGTDQFVDDRRKKLEEKSGEGSVTVVKDVNELQNILPFIIPENSQDLVGKIDESYYNIMGIQKELLNSLPKDDPRRKQFEENLAANDLVNKPMPMEEDSLLAKLYNEEIAKLAIFTQSYILNFEPLKSIEKSGAIEGLQEGIFGESKIGSDKAINTFYNNFIAPDSELSKLFPVDDPEVRDILDKTFTNKVAVGTPDFLMIMAEFALTRKLAGGSIKRVGEFAEGLVSYLGGGARASRYIGAFVEEVAAIETVNVSFGEDMSWMFGVTGPVGKLLQDFYGGIIKASGKLSNAEFNALSNSQKVFNKVGNFITKQPLSVRMAEGGILNVGTSAVVLKVGEIPESIIASIEEGNLEPLLHVFDPEEFAVLATQLTVTKGFAPIKGFVNTVDVAVKEIKNRRENKKYKEKITEYNNLIFGDSEGSSAKNRETRNDEIDAEASKKLKELGVTENFVNFFKEMGFTLEDINNANSIKDLYDIASKWQGQRKLNDIQLNDLKKGLDLYEKIEFDVNKIKEAVNVIDAKKGLKLDSEYLSFLESQKVQQESQKNITRFVESSMKGDVDLNASTINAIKDMNGSPELIKKVLDSYGIKPNASGSYGNKTLDLLLKQTEGGDYPNLSFINSRTAKGIQNNVDYNTTAGKKYLNNTIEVIKANNTIEGLKNQAKSSITPEAFKEQIKSAEEKRDALDRSSEEILQEVKLENQIKSEIYTEKVKSEKDKLGIQEVVKVKDSKELVEYYNNKVNENKGEIETLNEEINSLKEKDPNDPAIKTLEKSRDQLLKDNENYLSEVKFIKENPNLLQKGKAYEGEKGRSLVFNMEDIFKAGDPTVTGHELFHPFTNQVLKELALSDNQQSLNRFVGSFLKGLSDNQIEVVRARLSKQGIDLKNIKDLESLSHGEKLEVLNAWVEGVILREIDISEAKNPNEVVEAVEYLIEENAEGNNIDLNIEKAETILQQYAVEALEFFNPLKPTSRKFDIVARVLAQDLTSTSAENLNPGFDFVQSSAEGKKNKATLEQNLERFENELAELPAGSEKIPTLKRNIKILKDLKNRGEELNNLFGQIEKSTKTSDFQETVDLVKQNNPEGSIKIPKRSTYEAEIFKMALKAEPSVVKVTNKIIELANKPGGTLSKLKKSFDFSKVDQQYDLSEQREFKKDFDAQADAYFSIELNKYLAKPFDQRAPFEVYLRESLGKKMTNTLDKSQKKDWTTRINDNNRTAIESGYLSEPVDSPLEMKPDKVEDVKPVFEIGEEVTEQANKALLSIYQSTKTDTKALTTEVDSNIRIFLTDTVKKDMLEKAEGKNLKERTEYVLRKNYDIITKYIESNGPWFRLRNFPLFYKPQLTEGGNIARKGKAEEPQYDAIVPDVESFVKFFMAEGTNNPSNIRSQRMLKFYELMGRIIVSEANNKAALNGGNVKVGNTVINAGINATGQNAAAYTIITKIGEQSTPRNLTVQSSLEVDANPDMSSTQVDKLANSEEFHLKVTDKLTKEFGYNPMIRQLAIEAEAKGETTIVFKGREYEIDKINIATSDVQTEIIYDALKPRGEEKGTQIKKLVQDLNADVPENIKEGLIQNDLVGKKVEKERRKQSDQTNFFYKEGDTYVLDLDKRNEYIKSASLIAEYGIKPGILPDSQYKNLMNDHSRNTGEGRLLSSIKIIGKGAEQYVLNIKNDLAKQTFNIENFKDLNAEQQEVVNSIYNSEAKVESTPFLIQEQNPNLKFGSKNKYTQVDVSETMSLSHLNTLSKFLKLAEGELDDVTGNTKLDGEKRAIRNLLKKYGIDYTNHAEAKAAVAKLMLDPKVNKIKKNILDATYLGLYDMYWENEGKMSEQDLTNLVSVMVKFNKGDSQNILGRRQWFPIVGTYIKELKHSDVYEKLEHGYDIARANREVLTAILNKDRAKVEEILTNLEAYTGQRTEFDKVDKAINANPNTIDPNIPISTKALLESANEYTFMKSNGEVTSWKKEFDSKFLDMYPKLDSKLSKAQKEQIQIQTFKNSIYNGKIEAGEIPNEIQRSVEQFKEKEKNEKTNKEVQKKEVYDKTDAPIVDNAIVPEQNVSNAQALDIIDETNGNKSFTIEKEEGTYSYNSETQVMTTPNNTGKFNTNKKVVFLAGGAGSGKGTTWTKITNQHPELKGLKIVNSDFEKQRLKKEFELGENETEYKEDERSLLSRITAIAVNEAKLERKDLTEEGKGYVVDGTLASYKSNKKAIQELRDKGYEVQIVYTKTDVETASKRNAAREERSINDKFLRRNHEDVNNTIEMFRADGENIIEFSGEGDFNSKVATEVYNSLNKNNKYDIVVDQDTKVQRSTEYYEQESNRIISDTFKTTYEPMDKATAEKLSLKAKGKFRLMGFRAQQAMNLMLETVGKGDKEGLAYMENGVDLADKGRYNFGNYSSSTRRDIKKLNKDNEDIGLDKEALKVEASGKTVTYTRSDMVRMYLFDYKMKGVSDNVRLQAKQYIANDVKLLEYAENIKKAINKSNTNKEQSEFFEPYMGWGLTTLEYDINRAIESKRAIFMDPFKKWYNATFNESNMNKIESGMTPKEFDAWKTSTQDWYERSMTNRTSAQGERVGQKFINWLHGSTAIALFGNRKSAFTQLLSTTNFYGAENNNIFDAAAAYGNKEIFEMMKYILKSDYLKDRRGSYDLAIKEINELQSKYGDMYKKGVNLSFLLSQLGDNAAITIGGASMLLNNYKRLMRDNPDLTKDQALEMAMEKVALHSERTQQSTWASNLTYQQTKAIGKVTLNFLNTQIRYNNIALEEAKKIRKGVSGNVTKSLMRIINYTGLQTAGFAALSSGLQFAMLDDEMDPEQKDDIVVNKREEIIANTMLNVINGTGITGKITTTLIGMLDEAIEFGTDEQKREAQLAKKLLQASPALSIKFRKLESVGYDYQQAMKNYQKGKPFMRPAGRAVTNLFSAATNLEGPAYIYSLLDQFEFIMDERNTFWQKFGVAMGWSLYSIDEDFYKKRKERESEGTTNLFGAGEKVESKQGTYTVKGRKKKVKWVYDD